MLFGQAVTTTHTHISATEENRTRKGTAKTVFVDTYLDFKVIWLEIGKRCGYDFTPGDI